MKLIDPARLAFLSGVVNKEVALLLQSTHELQPVFVSNTDAEIALNLSNLPTPSKLADQLELFAGRFSRLQDTVGDKLLEQLMRSLGEPPLAQLAKLDTAERLTAQVSKLIAKASKLTAPSRSNEQAKPDVGSH